MIRDCAYVTLKNVQVWKTPKALLNNIEYRNIENMKEVRYDCFHTIV